LACQFKYHKRESKYWESDFKEETKKIFKKHEEDKNKQPKPLLEGAEARLLEIEKYQGIINIIIKIPHRLLDYFDFPL